MEAAVDLWSIIIAMMLPSLHIPSLFRALFQFKINGRHQYYEKKLILYITECYSI